MARRVELEIHKYIDSLCGRGFFGEITLYFQGGDIGNIRETARLGKKDIIDQYSGIISGEPARRVIRVAPRREAEKDAV
jgi:hypothetical protein